MEKVAPALQRRLDMQAYIREHLTSEHYYDVQQFLNEMAEMQGKEAPALEQLVDENISPDIQFLTYAFNKVQEYVKKAEREIRESVKEYLRSYLRINGWQKVFNLIELTGLPQETIANILSGDESVPMELIADAYNALQRTQEQTSTITKSHL